MVLTIVSMRSRPGWGTLHHLPHVVSYIQVHSSALKESFNFRSWSKCGRLCSCSFRNASGISLHLPKSLKSEQIHPGPIQCVQGGPLIAGEMTLTMYIQFSQGTHCNIETIFPKTRSHCQSKAPRSHPNNVRSCKSKDTFWADMYVHTCKTKLGLIPAE